MFAHCSSKYVVVVVPLLLANIEVTIKDATPQYVKVNQTAQISLACSEYCFSFLKAWGGLGTVTQRSCDLTW